MDKDLEKFVDEVNKLSNETGFIFDYVPGDGMHIRRTTCQMPGEYVYDIDESGESTVLGSVVFLPKLLCHK